VDPHEKPFSRPGNGFGLAASPLNRGSLRCTATGLLHAIPQAAFYSWLEERLEIQSLADDFTSKFVPPHTNMFYCLGGMVFVGFAAQFTSGALLTLYFRASVLDSFLPSLLARAEGIDSAWFLRAFHRLQAASILLFMVPHISRVFFTGGQFRPRELTWVSGLALALLAGAASVSGYTLPWDQIGFWAFQIVSAIPSSFDLYAQGAGTFLVFLLRGGATLGQLALTRCAFAHTLLLPAATLLVVVFHFLCIRKQGISGPL
jgi:cytochrome b6